MKEWIEEFFFSKNRNTNDDVSQKMLLKTKKGFKKCYSLFGSVIRVFDKKCYKKQKGFQKMLFDLWCSVSNFVPK